MWPNQMSVSPAEQNSSVTSKFKSHFCCLRIAPPSEPHSLCPPQKTLIRRPSLRNQAVAETLLLRNRLVDCQSRSSTYPRPASSPRKQPQRHLSAVWSMLTSKCSWTALTSLRFCSRTSCHPSAHLHSRPHNRKGHIRSSSPPTAHSCCSAQRQQCCSNACAPG